MGWLVEMPPTLVDLARGERPAQAQQPELGPTGIAVFDGFQYGQDCLLLHTPSPGTKQAITEFVLPRLPPGADLRALVGLTRETPVGAQARVSFRFAVGDEVVRGVEGVQLRMRRMDFARWPERLPNATAIVECSVPASVCESDAARLQIVVSRVGDTAATIALPCLRVTGE